MRARFPPLFTRGCTAQRRRTLTIALLLVAMVPLATGCLRVTASITISPDNLVSGKIIAAAKPKNKNDAGPQLNDNLPFSQKIAVSNYNSDGYVGSQAVFSDLTFAELPQLANMNSSTTDVTLSLRRNGNLVILESRADLTSVTDPDADVELTVAFPGVVTSTNGDRIETKVVAWKLKPGVVSTMSARARYTDPDTRSFTGAAVWLGIASFSAASVVVLLAWNERKSSARLQIPRDSSSS
ncbi:lipoprotein [Mycobacterium leprae Kyoto-2]|uniref:Lipoprotein n=4 Tax=Mycobacterium leprae TaxID=1769 RepID=O69564_MYCLR|nr:lipoprotein [Mycobacterium leprae]OAR21582.1 DUF3153 domain-containing protein [Mycobacterium leprae 3125609]OAX71742.1 DUF3153 domain-containing protein [Mycobacterium leprae 7935681]CAR70997.1 probable lipoprotein [Mycobacterium leprae Br4923]BBC16848.1 lipoprotein [Mycobacterium leprae Kyoto-2]